MKTKCPKCGYEWESRTGRKPKACPYCKNYLPLLKHQAQLKKRKEVQNEETN